MTLDLHTQGFLDALARIDARKEKKEMPVYEYKCKTCELTMKLVRKISEPERNPGPCVNCLTDLVRVYDAPALTFNGTGWASKEK